LSNISVRYKPYNLFYMLEQILVNLQNTTSSLCKESFVGKLLK